jgi:hypothetical protein
MRKIHNAEVYNSQTMVKCFLKRMDYASVLFYHWQHQTTNQLSNVLPPPPAALSTTNPVFKRYFICRTFFAFLLVLNGC